MSKKCYIMSKECYICAVEDGNETPFNPEDHQVCLICAVKLRSMGMGEGAEFDCGPVEVHVICNPIPPDVWHVTRVGHGSSCFDVYGHLLNCCDEAGCSGQEQYMGVCMKDAEGVVPGALVEVANGFVVGALGEDSDG